MNDMFSGLLIRSKKVLKTVPSLIYINEKIKAAKLRRARASLLTKYERLAASRQFVYSPHWARATLRQRLGDRSIKCTTEGKPRVFWIGANWDQDSSGFLVSLGKMAELSCAMTRSGQYGHAISMRQNSTSQPDFDIIAQNDSQLLEQITSAHAKRRIDLVWGQMWANYVSPNTLRKVQDLGIPVVNVAMDDRLPGHWADYESYRLGSSGLRQGVDLVLTTSPECCAWYGCEGVPALFWPLASDPAHFRPAPEAEKCFDVSFVGNRYGVRARIVDALVKARLNVAAFGGGWPRGYVDATQISQIFAQSRIVLGIGTVGHNEDVFTLKLRDFDAPMSGALYLTHRNPDLLSLYREGEEIECYETVSECISKIRYYLGNADERLRIAAAGRKRALQDHTWDLRIKQAFAEVGINVQ